MILVDGDCVVYSVAFACQTSEKQEDGETKVTVESEDYCQMILRKVLQSLIDKFPDEPAKIFLSPEDSKENYRFRLKPTVPYKGNRKAEKPVYYDYVRQLLVEEYYADVTEGQEADDALGIALMGTDNVLCSIDKDLDMVPGRHYNWRTESYYETSDPGHLRIKKVGKVKKLQGGGYRWFYAQLCLGDPADNIKCLNGWGPVKTYKELKDLVEEKDLFDKVKGEYIKLDREKDFWDNVDLLWIRRYPGQMKSKELRNEAKKRKK